jgi:AcrR family transcriptional regulator
VTVEATATDTREVIIESAIGCFGRQGLTKTTVVDIARAADVSRSTVYEYFRDKAEIVEACAEHSSQRFYREMARAMGRGESLEDKLTLAAVFVARAVRRARNVLRCRRSEPAAHEERRGATA